jgi:hypothetical protein
MLQEVLDGRLSYTELPMLYNGGFISIKLINEAKKVTGRFFKSMTPDVYSAMALSLITEDYIYSHEPLAINGASVHSGGTAGFEKVKRTRAYDPAVKFWSEENIPFHKDLPVVEHGRPVRSIQVIVYEAYLQASAFHSLKAVKTSHAEQLELVLRKSGPNSKEIEDWAKLFEVLHGLKIEQRSVSKFRTFFWSTGSFLRRIHNGLFLFVVRGSARIGLQNVYDAAIVAGAAKQFRPWMLSRVMSRFKRWGSDA